MSEFGQAIDIDIGFDTAILGEDVGARLARAAAALGASSVPRSTGDSQAPTFN
jgi:hypothetical protein